MYFKIILIKIKWMIYNVYPYIWTPSSMPLGLLFLLCSSDQQKYKLCRRSTKEHSYQVPFPPVVSEKKTKMYKLTDDDGHQLMTIHHMTFWVRWAKKLWKMWKTFVFPNRKFGSHLKLVTQLLQKSDFHITAE